MPVSDNVTDTQLLQKLPKTCKPSRLHFNSSAEDITESIHLEPLA